MKPVTRLVPLPRAAVRPNQGTNTSASPIMAPRYQIIYPEGDRTFDRTLAKCNPQRREPGSVNLKRNVTRGYLLCIPPIQLPSEPWIQMAFANCPPCSFRTIESNFGSVCSSRLYLYILLILSFLQLAQSQHIRMWSQSHTHLATRSFVQSDLAEWKNRP